jgi:hypothetical protein
MINIYLLRHFIHASLSLKSQTKVKTYIFWISMAEAAERVILKSGEAEEDGSR